MVMKGVNKSLILLIVPFLRTEILNIYSFLGNAVHYSVDIFHKCMWMSLLIVAKVMILIAWAKRIRKSTGRGKSRAFSNMFITCLPLRHIKTYHFMTSAVTEGSWRNNFCVDDVESLKCLHDAPSHVWSQSRAETLKLQIQIHCFTCFIWEVTSIYSLFLIPRM